MRSEIFRGGSGRLPPRESVFEEKITTYHDHIWTLSPAPAESYERMLFFVWRTRFGFSSGSPVTDSPDDMPDLSRRAGVLRIESQRLSTWGDERSSELYCRKPT